MEIYLFLFIACETYTTVGEFNLHPNSLSSLISNECKVKFQCLIKKEMKKMMKKELVVTPTPKV